MPVSVKLISECCFSLFRTCRQKYYKHIKKAKQNPEKYCSIIIDNMDQAKTNLPRFRIPTKVVLFLHFFHRHPRGYYLSPVQLAGVSIET